MKTARLTAPLFLILLMTVSVVAQETTDPADPSDVVVVEQSWRKEVIDTLRDKNPLKPNEDLIRVTRQQKEFIKGRDDAMPNQPTEPSMPAQGPRPVTPERGIWTWYVYNIMVKNIGEKKIKLIDWEYQFLDPDTQQIREQRKITTRLQLSPGKSQLLERRMTRKPTVVVNADQLARKYKDQFKERGVITRIVYSDGSVWRRPKTD